MYTTFPNVTCKKLLHVIRLFKSHGLQASSYTIDGKIGIVTGGADGIGLACTKELLKKGMKGITIGDLKRKKETMEEINRDCGKNKALFVKANVTVNQELEDVFEATITKWKAVDIVINNAGILDDKNWEREIKINVTAVVRGTYIAMKYMSKEKGGKGGVIVNVASTYGMQPFRGSPVYVGTKHFVIGFNRSLGDPENFKKTGVRILTLCPGVTVRPSEAAAGMVTLLKEGKSGSVWISEGADPVYEVSIPDWSEFEKKKR